MSILNLQAEFESALADTGNFYEQWVSFYKLREKVTCAPDRRGELEEPEVRFRKLEVGDRYMLTRGYRPHSNYSTPMWVLSTQSKATRASKLGSSRWWTRIPFRPPTGRLQELLRAAHLQL
jgi:hypothetical protein